MFDAHSTRYTRLELRQNTIERRSYSVVAAYLRRFRPRIVAQRRVFHLRDLCYVSTLHL
jgi:hypothetical protein